MKLWFTNHISFRTAVLRKLFEIRFSYNTVISNAFAYSSRWRRKPWQGLFSQPLECLYQELCKHRKKVFYCFYKITFPRKKAMIKRQILTSREVLYTKLVHCTRNQSLFCKKRCFPKYRYFSLKISAQAKKKIDKACFYWLSKFQPTRKWVNKVNLSRFSTQNLFQIRACVISARKGKHLDVTTISTYSHANTPLGQSSERAYYLSYYLYKKVICYE